ncbi:uncharacterized protein LOC124258758 [Haliotis rubra]|uniref:uncharacterized protein LOC124258758 n=1 Tax=Haliotis rubra TaxID=36100 RepID=UPI001EE4F715|nr:uncharacterized protein LOC124258758 [Haliotis rubra]
MTSHRPNITLNDHGDMEEFDLPGEEDTFIQWSLKLKHSYIQYSLGARLTSKPLETTPAGPCLAYRNTRKVARGKGAGNQLSDTQLQIVVQSLRLVSLSCFSRLQARAGVSLIQLLHTTTQLVTVDSVTRKLLTMANLIGVWKVVPERTTGHDEFATALGMTDTEREATRDMVYTMYLSRDGEVWHMKNDLEDGTVFMDVKFTMGVPFHYLSIDKVTKLTSVIRLQNDRFVEKLTVNKDGVIKELDVETYREGDFVVTTQTKDGKIEKSYLRKL